MVAFLVPAVDFGLVPAVVALALVPALALGPAGFLLAVPFFAAVGLLRAAVGLLGAAVGLLRAGVGSSLGSGSAAIGTES